MSLVSSDLSSDSSGSEFSTPATSPDSSPESPRSPSITDISKRIQISESGSLPLTPASIGGINKHVIRPITITPRHRAVPKLRLRDRSISPGLKKSCMPEVHSRFVQMNRTPRNLVPESWTKYGNTPRVKSNSSTSSGLTSHSLPSDMDATTNETTTTVYTTVFVKKPRHKNNPRQITEINQEDLDDLSARLRRNSRLFIEAEQAQKSVIARLYEKFKALCLRICSIVKMIFTCQCFRRV